MIPILREVAMLGGYLECVVEVYVVEMWSDGGAWWWMVEEVWMVDVCVVDLCIVERRGGGDVVCGTQVPMQQISFLVPLVVVPS